MGLIIVVGVEALVQLNVTQGDLWIVLFEIEQSLVQESAKLFQKTLRFPLNNYLGWVVVKDSKKSRKERLDVVLG